VKITGRRGNYSWHLSRPRRIKPFPIKGNTGMMNVDVPADALAVG
jgi:hypothetical protein